MKMFVKLIFLFSDPPSPYYTVYFHDAGFSPTSCCVVPPAYQIHVITWDPSAMPNFVLMSHCKVCLKGYVAICSFVYVPKCGCTWALARRQIKPSDNIQWPHDLATLLMHWSDWFLRLQINNWKCTVLQK